MFNNVQGEIRSFLLERKTQLKTIVEIGSHFGTDTIELRRILPKSDIICFEPDPRNINIIKKNWAGNPIAYLYEFAVSDFNGKTKFHLSSGDCSFWTNDELWSKNEWSASSSLKKPVKHITVHPWINFNEEIEVECIKLDDFIPLQNKVIDFIWMDVQGAEDLVLKGAKNTLSKTRFLYTEYDNEELYENQLNLEGILNILGPDWKVLSIFDNDVLLENITI